MWTTSTCHGLDWHKAISDVVDHVIISSGKLFDISSIIVINVDNAQGR